MPNVNSPSLTTTELNNLTENFSRKCQELNLKFPCCVGVSGGSDSLALLHLLKRISNNIVVVTVDHHLRKESSDEAKIVSKWCQNLGIQHHTLVWSRDQSPEMQQGNVMKQARDARYNLLSNFCILHQIQDICIGHTQDDQAETVLMRLMRGSGVDGLSAIKDIRRYNSVRIVRPVLSFSRNILRGYLHSIRQEWIDDPSNIDRKYERIRTRDMIRSCGFSQSRLAKTAVHMQRAQEVLEHQCVLLKRECLTIKPARIYSVDKGKFLEGYIETQLRLLSEILQKVSGKVYRADLKSLERLHEEIIQKRNGGYSLHGCIIRFRKYVFLVYRELENCEIPIVVDPNQIVTWDKRYQVLNKSSSSIIARALGNTFFENNKAWKALPLAARQSCLSIWENEELICVPDAGFSNSNIVIRSI